MAALQFTKVRPFTKHLLHTDGLTLNSRRTRSNLVTSVKTIHKNVHGKHHEKYAEATHKRWTSCTGANSVWCSTVGKRSISTSNRMSVTAMESKTSPSGRTSARRVWVSSSTDVFANLALEDWLYTQHPFHDDHNLLLLWRNNPCIVIGRHQNPWAECDITACVRDGVDVARRNSGGGAVYHDLGNVCVSFFTKRESYNRRANLQFVVDAITDDWPRVDLSLNSRDDMLLDEKYKISGTAAKLGGKTAYHHFTLLTDVNKANLQKYLTTGLGGLMSRATCSVRSAVRNLREADPTVSWDGLVKSLSSRFLQDTSKQASVEYVDAGSEATFPGVGAMREALRGWTWVYSRTPKFTIRRTFVDLSDATHRNLDIFLEVDKGMLSRVVLDGSVVKDLGGLQTMIELHLYNQPFRRNVIDDVMTDCYGNVMDVKSAKVYLWIWQCLKSIFMSANI